MTTLSVTRSEKRLTLDVGDGVKTVSVPRTTARIITAAIQGLPGRDGAAASEPEIRAIAADQDTVQIYDYDAIVAATLGV